MKAGLIAAVLSIAGLLWLTAMSSEPPPGPLPPSPFDEDMDLLQKHALNDAYEAGMKNLFTVWLREVADARDADRQIAGADKLRRAYVAVRSAIEKREAERSGQEKHP